MCLLVGHSWSNKGKEKEKKRQLLINGRKKHEKKKEKWQAMLNHKQILGCAGGRESEVGRKQS